MPMPFEEIKMMEKHSSAMKPLLDLLNTKYAAVTPAVERKDHPLHNSYINAVNRIAAVSEMLLETLNEGGL